MESLVKGTIENIAVEVDDRLGSLTDLVATGPTYSVRARDAGTTWISQNLAAVTNGMIALCLIDTTNNAYVEGKYELYLKFNNLSETPVLGPHIFEVAYA
jgi:hypothetical protein